VFRLWVGKVDQESKFLQTIRKVMCAVQVGGESSSVPKVAIAMKTLSEPAIVSSRKACLPTAEHPQGTRDGVPRKDQNANENCD
jgi:hypothetical protein